MLFESKLTRESISHPGVKFTVRRLNMIQRAKRDAGVAKQRLEYTGLLSEQRYRVNQLVGELPPVGDLKALEERRKKLIALPPDQQAELLDLEHRADLLHKEFLIPATIKAGLLSIEGAEMDGVTLTTETLIESGPDDLIAEIYAACEETDGLSGEEQKNLQSPGTSAGHKDGNSPSGSADPASSTDSTSSGIAAVA